MKKEPKNFSYLALAGTLVPPERDATLKQRQEQKFFGSFFQKRTASFTLVLACLSQATAQPNAAASPQFQSVLQSQQHRKAVLDAAKHSTTWTKHGCSDALFTPLPGLRIWKKPEFDHSSTPSAGIWIESVVVTGCGLTRTLNVVTSVRSLGALVTGLLAPGDTAADPVLQRDAVHHAFAAGALKAPGCRQAYLDDTRQVAAHHSDAARFEDWIIMACGRPITVEMKFTPGANGTDITARVRR